MTNRDFHIIKELIELKELYYKKFLNYSELAVDPQIKQFFEKAAIMALNDKEKLVNYM